MTSSPPPPPPRFKPPSFTPPPPLRGGGALPPGAPPEGPAKKARGPLFWIVLGCTGCVLVPALLLALFAGAIGGGVFYLTREPVNSVRAQLEEIRDGRLDAAYARLSETYRARLTREAFLEMLEKHPALRDNASASFWNRSLQNDEMRLSGTLTGRSGAKEKAVYELVKERGLWKIQVIRFPDD